MSFLSQALPYCGAPPLPGDLGSRFNLDPVLIVVLMCAAGLHLLALRRRGERVALAGAGWVVTAAALISPLCALSVSLFSARVAQHMLLVLVAAPCIAASLPLQGEAGRPWPATTAFFLALWFWHMPVPYAATFHSTAVYWVMHLSLFGAAVWLWRVLIAHAPSQTMAVIAAGTVTTVQMALLGAVLTLSSRALFAPHYYTTQAWSFTPLDDQQLGGALMWVPGCLLLLALGLRSFALLWRSLEPARAA